MFFVNTLENFKLFLKSKTHNFQNLEKDVDYSVDFTKYGQCASLTTTKWIKVGETIILTYEGKPTKYYAESVDVYWNHDQIQTVLLRKLNDVSR
ncbi:MAG: hypothetical protein WBM44_17070 [Waterburya sp.]